MANKLVVMSWWELLLYFCVLHLLFLVFLQCIRGHIWISDFEEYSDLGRTILSYSSLAPVSVRRYKGSDSTEFLKVKVFIVASLFVASELCLSDKICRMTAVSYVLYKLHPPFPGSLVDISFFIIFLFEFWPPVLVNFKITHVLQLAQLWFVHMVTKYFHIVYFAFYVYPNATIDESIMCINVNKVCMLLWCYMIENRLTC